MHYTSDEPSDSLPPPQVDPDDISFLHQNMLIFIVCGVSFVLSIAGCFIPLSAAPNDQLSRRSIILFCMFNCLCGGMMLSSSLLHYIPIALSMSRKQHVPDFVPLIIVLVGVIFPFLLEKVISFIYKKKSQRQRYAVYDTPIDEEKGRGRRGYERKSEVDPMVSSLQISYGAAPVEVSAAEYRAGDVYLTRCVMCKDNVHTMKGLAYHAAGCACRSLQYFTMANRSLQAVRGRRIDKREWIDAEYMPYLLLIILSVYCFIIGASFTAHPLSFTETSQSLASSPHLVRALAFMLSILAYLWFNSFAVGLAFKQARTSLNTAICLVFGFSLMAPLGTLTTLFVSLHSSTVIAVWVQLSFKCLAAGIMLYCSIIEIILEEMERREGQYLKWFSLFCGMITMVLMASLST